MTLSGCLHCYFRFIEDEASPFLPEDKRRMIRRAHNGLLVRGFPRVAVDVAAAFELAVCRNHCPPHIVARIKADHAKLGLAHA